MQNDNTSLDDSDFDAEPLNLDEVPSEIRNLAVYHLASIYNRMTASNSRILKKYLGIGVTEARILRLLRIDRTTTPGRICQISSMNKSVVSRSLAGLEQQGYVLRLADPADARRNMWALTPSGTGLVDNGLKPLASAREEILMRGLSPEDRAKLMSFFEQMQRNMPALAEYEPQQARRRK